MEPAASRRPVLLLPVPRPGPGVQRRQLSAPDEPDPQRLTPRPPTYPFDDSRTALSLSRSFRLARRIPCATMGAASFENPDGSPRLRSVMRVPPVAVSSQV